MTRDDELLASYVAGELGDDSAEIRELFARRPDARASADELSNLSRELDAGGALERRLIAAARVQANASDRARVASAFEERRQTAHRGGAGRWLAAAAVVLSLLGVALYSQQRPAVEPQKQFLNDERGATISLRASQDELRAGVAFDWDAPPLAASERFSLEFRALDAGGSPGKLLRRVPCISASWTPSTADLSDWPEQVSLVISRVERGRDGHELAFSQPFSLRVAR